MKALWLPITQVVVSSPWLAVPSVNPLSLEIETPYFPADTVPVVNVKAVTPSNTLMFVPLPAKEVGVPLGLQVKEWFELSLDTWILSKPSFDLVKVCTLVSEIASPFNLLPVIVYVIATVSVPSTIAEWTPTTASFVESVIVPTVIVEVGDCEVATVQWPAVEPSLS